MSRGLVLTFEKFNKDNFNLKENYVAKCVFICKDGRFYDGLVIVRNNKIYFIETSFTDLEIDSSKIEYYMFKD